MILEQRVGARADLGAGEMKQVSHQVEVLAPGEQAVDGRELPGQADEATHGARVGRGVGPGDAHRPRVGGQQRAHRAYHGGLARAVGAQEGHDRAGVDA